MAELAVLALLVTGVMVFVFSPNFQREWSALRSEGRVASAVGAIF